MEWYGDRMNAVLLFSFLHTYFMNNEPTQEQLDQFVRINIGWCQSSLVEELLSREIVSYEDIKNYYEYKCPECGQGQIEPFDSEPIDPKNMTFDPPMHYKCYECNTEFEQEPEQEPQEIYEWWLVDDWMSEKLSGLGEPVLVTDFGTWWGRTCTGQAISLDYVIEVIYKSL